MGKFVITKTATGYMFDLRAANGEAIAASEVYRTEAACRKGIQAVIKCAPTAPLADLTGGNPLPPNPRIELFFDKNRCFRFRLRAKNGKIIAVSQRYKSRMACQNGIQSLRDNAAE